MNHITSYPSIYALGHRAIKNIFSSPVVIEEKVDGSQFSMSRTNGVLSCRSKGKDIVLDAPEKLFNQAIAAAQSLDLHDGWVYRGEYLQSPKHNTLAYSRIPTKHIILFDVMTGLETYLTPTEKKFEADRLGLECVPCLYDGTLMEDWPMDRTMSEAWAESLLQTESILGGQKVEGFVVKNYNIFVEPDKKIAVAKYVSANFKEKHRGEWTKANPGSADIVHNLITQLKTDARWRKAIQHLREVDKITDAPQDIGPLILEVQADIAKEETEYIKEALFLHFFPQIKRGVIAGLPEWYKKQLGFEVAA